jgi:hypothetical protein
MVWAGVIVTFFLVLGAYHLRRPELEFSDRTILTRSGICTATCQATNNSRTQISAVVNVVIGFGVPAGKYRPLRYHEVGRQALSLSLAPGESKTLTCDFSINVAPHEVNTTHIEIASLKRWRP